MDFMYLILSIIMQQFSAYMIESISLWHARLGHVNFSYIKTMQSLGLISGLDSSHFR